MSLLRVELIPVFLCLGVPTLKIIERVLCAVYVVIFCACFCLFVSEVSSFLVVIKFIFNPLEVRVALYFDCPLSIMV